MEPYELFFNEESVQRITALTARQRSVVLRHLAHLAAFPHQSPDAEFLTGRSTMHCAIRFGDWEIVYRVDGAVKQIQVIGIERIRRQP